MRTRRLARHNHTKKDFYHVKPLRVYRVENYMRSGPYNGFGAYFGDNISEDEAEDVVMWSDEFFDLTHNHDVTTQPTILDFDIDGCNKKRQDFEELFHDGHILSSYGLMRYGFPSMEALEQWFDSIDREVLSKCGFGISSYLTHYYLVSASGRQVMFVPKDGSRKVIEPARQPSHVEIVMNYEFAPSL